MKSNLIAGTPLSFFHFFVDTLKFATTQLAAVAKLATVGRGHELGWMCANARKLRKMRRAPLALLFTLPLFIAIAVILYNFRASSIALSEQEAARHAAALLARRELAHDEARALLPQCSQRKPRAKSFVLLFMGHSGSTALISALAQHESVLVRGFEPVDHGTFATDTDAALSYARAFFRAGLERNLTAGFKIRPHHILRNPSAWGQLFREYDTRIIWNYRANIFKQAVGHYPIVYLKDKSRYEGIKHGERAEARRTSYRIHDMDALYRLLSARFRGERKVEDAIVALHDAACVLPVSYELLLRQPGRAQLAIQAHLGLTLNESLQAQRSKATGDNMCEVVTNWNEVCNAFFICHRWRGMMDDAEHGCSCPVATGMNVNHAQRFCQPDRNRAFLKVLPSKHVPNTSTVRKEAAHHPSLANAIAAIQKPPLQNTTAKHKVSHQAPVSKASTARKIVRIRRRRR